MFLLSILVFVLEIIPAVYFLSSGTSKGNGNKAKKNNTKKRQIHTYLCLFTVCIHCKLNNPKSSLNTNNPSLNNQ